MFFSLNFGEAAEKGPSRRLLRNEISRPAKKIRRLALREFNKARNEVYAKGIRYTALGMRLTPKIAIFSYLLDLRP